jgi:hypothetical protein
MDAEAELASFLARFTPEIAAKARDVRAILAARMPHAVQLIYDNYNALVIGFGPSERASEAIFSIAIYPRWVNIFFLQAVRQRLDDPQGLLKGEGSTVRHVRIDDPAKLDEPALRALLERSLRDARVPLVDGASGRTVVRAVAAKQRARRPA